MANDKSKKAFYGVTDFFSEMNRMTNVMYGREPEHKRRSAENAWAPLTDIRADGADLLVRLELPGVDMGNIDISFTNGMLVVSGNRQTADGHYYVHERFSGAFRRVISLPEGIGDNDIEAKLEQGLLIIRIAGGANASEPKKIKISGSND